MTADAPDPADPRAARLRELRALVARGATPQELAIHLAASGYDPERAAALIDQLTGDAPLDDGVPAPAESDGSRPSDDPESRERSAPALRVWAPFERARFSPEAWGQLLRLRAGGMSDAEFEHLVDRALLQLDGPVGVGELRSLLGDMVATAVPPPPTVH